MNFSFRHIPFGRTFKWVGASVASLLGLALLLGLAAFLFMRGSLPMLDGEVPLAGLKRPVSVTRDLAGVVSIKADETLDAVRALGFVHAQERFFEMDLARRSAAGELSELLGTATLPLDRDKRRHRLRARAAAEWARAPAMERAWLTAYTEGVNAGMAALSVRPWQYLVLNSEPKPWEPADSLLVLSEMFVMLQAGSFADRWADIRLRSKLGGALFEWMRPPGGYWDATLDEIKPESPPMPGPDVIDTRKRVSPPRQSSARPLEEFILDDAKPIPGSNNWAVSGGRTKDGRAILANDMHLNLGVPSIWFRAELHFRHEGTDYRAVGLTLPGVPQIVVGSNGFIAWGLTNSMGQWFDWIEVPKSSVDLRTVHESIQVKGAPSETLVIKELPQGPVLHSTASSDFALAWVLYRPGAMVNRVDAMMLATSIDAAIARAHETPIPHQNLMMADANGNIAWTITGRIPERSDRAVRRGMKLDASAQPEAWAERGTAPVIMNPADGLLWTANSRQLGGKSSNIIGDGGFDLGARSQQIRDRLRERQVHDEASLYAIQRDNESRFLKRWAGLIEKRAAVPNAPAEIVALWTELKRWNGKADVDQTGHRILRSFRNRVKAQCWRAWLKASNVDLSLPESAQEWVAPVLSDDRVEYALWQAISLQPGHLLPDGHQSWDQFLDAQILWTYERLNESASRSKATLADMTWGKLNMSRIQHPFSLARPFLSPFLDMPPRPLAGDHHMPLVADPSFGASQRLVVAPGREEEGILTVAGGQSGHPLSPFYGAGHREWYEGIKQPLLAQAPLHTLKLGVAP